MSFLKKNYSFLVNLLFAVLILSGAILFLTPSAALAGQAVVKGSVVNLRAAPSTSSDIVGKVVRGDSLDYRTRLDDWCQVRNNGVLCWVAGWLVDVVEDHVEEHMIKPADTAGGATMDRVEATADIVNIRGGPGTTYIVMERASKGNCYDYLEKSGDWYKIKLSDGSGWISAQYSKVVKVAAVPAQSVLSGSDSSNVVVKGSGVNVRSGPGTNYSVISSANKGDRFMLLDKSADWYKIELKSGGTGWLVAWLANVENVKDPAAEPFVPAPVSRGSDNHKTSTDTTDTTADTNTDVNADTNTDTNKAVIKTVTAKTEGLYTVVTIQSDGTALNHSISTLSNPDRLFIDINGLEPGSGVPDKVNYSSQLVNGVRVALNSNNPVVTRVVIDLKSVCTYEKKFLDNNSTLSLTIKPRDARPVPGTCIVLDPGHGGSDPGAIGPSGLKEKEVNLDIALKTAQYLRSKGATVILTRTDDSSVDLDSRPEFAIRNNASLFVSIHSNSNPSINYGGTSTYYLKTPAEGEEQLKLEGMYLAKSIQSSLLSDLKRDDRGTLQADYVVLAKSEVPAALVEVAYLSFQEEEKLLASTSFRSKAAIAIGKGIEAYLSGK